MNCLIFLIRLFPLFTFVIAATAALAQNSTVQSGTVLRDRDSKVITFNKDIAPIIFRNCAICHRPGQSAPFTLLTYRDVEKRAKQIVQVTQRRYMPPWLPEPGYGDFAGERRLSEAQIETIRLWVEQGASEGNASDLPDPPRWPDGWILGKPDLIVTMPKPYTLPSQGKDIYRNFVLPVEVTSNRYVRGVEFQPGNPKIVHHAFINLDKARGSRRLDGEDGQPGFAGMNLSEGVEMPGGHFLAWQPGKLATFEPDGLAWSLEKNSDLILQMHLRPSGKTETLQSRIGLYFTDQPPTKSCSKFVLVNLDIDIPPGETNYVVTSDVTVPVDFQVLGILPHAHYLCKRMEGFATLPDGTRKWLLLIKNWDFNWQGDYRYRIPVSLPHGTKLSMRYTYDNSTNNTANPNNPPRRVKYGRQSSDEMAELWFQLLPSNPADAKALADADAEVKRVAIIAYDEYLLRTDPKNAQAHTELGFIRFLQGKPGEAIDHLRTAIALDPASDKPHYKLGVVFRQQGRLAEAQTELETALQLNPANNDAHGNLGVIFAEQGKLQLAEQHLRSALRINPDDAIAKSLLAELLEAESKLRRKN